METPCGAAEDASQLVHFECWLLGDMCDSRVFSAYFTQIA